MTPAAKPFRIAQVLLTLGVLEFFGPIVRDTSVTHLLNPAWVGHARFHLMWGMVFMGLSGLCNLYLIWVRRPLRVSNLYIAWLWQACNIFGFWGAALLESTYGGAIVDPEFHLKVLGLNENIFAFVVLTLLLVSTLVFLKTRVEPAS
ncbi:MAG: hypothetical protein WBM46_05220 [Polyangiales bacterium]